MIETLMARQVGMKVFRTFTNEDSISSSGIPRISKAVEDWYEGGCANSELENVFIGDVWSPWEGRPRYEKL